MAELGVAYLSIIPETSKLAPGIRRALRSMDTPKVSPEVDQKSAAKAEQKLDRVARDRKSEIKVDVDSSGITKTNRLLGDTVSLADRSALSFGQMAIAAGTLGTALIPAAAAAGGLAAALSAPLAAAGGGLTVWGLLAGAAVKETNKQYAEIEELRKKLGGLEKGTEEYAAAQKSLKSRLDALTPAQKKYKNSLDGVKATLLTMVGGATGSALLGPMADGLDLVRRAMKLSEPIIVGVGDALSDVIGSVARWSRGNEAKGFINWFAHQAPPAIKTFSTIIGNVAIGVGGLIRSFSPLGTDVLGWIQGVTREFREFGQTAGTNPAVQNFLQYVREVGPQVGDTLFAVAQALGKILLAGAPIGSVVLKAIEGVANAINAIPTDVLTTFIVALGAYKVAALLAAGASKALAGRVALLRFGGLAIGIGLLTSNLGSLDKSASKSDKALAALKNTAGGAAAGFAVGGPWGAAIGGGIGLLWSLTDAAYDATGGFKSMFNTMEAGSSLLGGTDTKIGASFRGAGEMVKFLTKKAFGNESATKAMRRQHRLAISDVDELKSSLNEQSGALTKNTKRIILNDFAEKGGLRITRAAGISTGIVTKALYGNSKAQKFLFRELNNTNGKTKAQREAMKKLWPMIHASNTELRTAQNRQKNLAEAQRNSKKPMSELREDTERLRKKNKALADSVKGIPANPTISYKSYGFQAVMDEINSLIGGAQDIFDMFAGARSTGPGGESRTGNVPMRAAGGPVYGPGTSTSDSIPALLSNGEFVMRTSAVQKYGTAMMQSINAGRFADGGQAGRDLGGFGLGSGFRSLWRNEIHPALNRLIRALRAESDPSYTRSGSGRGSANQFLDGFDGSPDFLNGFGKGRLEGFDKGFKKLKPALQGFQKGMKDSRDATIGMELAVGKSSKKMGKYWTVLRKGPVKHFSKDWMRTTRDAERDIIHMQREEARQTGRVGKDFLKFRRGPLKSFDKDWGQTFRKDAPSDVGEFRSKTLGHMSGTASGISKTWRDRVRPTLHEFGAYPKQDVAPAFGKGVDAIGGQWDKVRKATGKPVKFVVDTVLNKGLLSAFNKIAKFVDTDTIKKIALPKGFDTGGYTGKKPTHAVAGVVHGDEFVLRSEAQRSIEKQRPGFLNRLNKMGAKALPGHREGGFVNPDKRVYLDGEPLSAIHAAQLRLASRLSRTPIHVMQGSWQPATSYSGTSHTGPGVADTSPGSFDQQKWQRKVGIAAWGRNFPGAAYAGSGAHIHGVSLLSPGARSQGQRDDYLNGGDGLGGSDYGPRPSILPNLREMLKRFGPLPSTLGGMAPMLPPWAQKIMSNPKKWARGLLGDKLQGGGFKGVAQGLLDRLIAPSAQWASGQLGQFGGTGGVPGGPMPGPKQLSKASPQLAKRYAYGRLKAFGFGKNQWGPLQNLWEKESGWLWNADNPTSPAYGIPQANPGSKMASTGANWYTNAGTQVNWGLGYIKGRYGNPANAWKHSQANDWYDLGGIANRAGLLPKLTPEPERVLAPRQTVAFEQMVARNFQPNSGADTNGWQEIRITNWTEGRGYIRQQAAGEIGTQVSHARTTGRQWA